MGFSRAFVEKANHAFDKCAGNHDELSFGVIRTSEDDDNVVE